MLVRRDIREVWEQIKPGLLEIKRLTPPPQWKPEDVYHECLAEKSHVYMDLEGSPGEFVVLQSGVNPYTAETELTVWIAYSKNPHASDTHLGDIVKLAKSINAHRLIMQSPRKGFSRSRWWKSFAVEYHMDVDAYEQ